jgi:hypothetical protein
MSFQAGKKRPGKLGLSMISDVGPPRRIDRFICSFANNGVCLSIYLQGDTTGQKTTVIIPRANYQLNEIIKSKPPDFPLNFHDRKMPRLPENRYQL